MALQGHFNAKIADGEVLHILCPSCDRQVDSEEIERVVEQAMFEKYLTFSERARLQVWHPRPLHSRSINVRGLVA